MCTVGQEKHGPFFARDDAERARPIYVAPKSIVKEAAGRVAYVETVPCYKCGGRGIISVYGHVEGGICFACYGKKYKIHARVAYSDARLSVLEERQARRDAAKVRKARAEFRTAIAGWELVIVEAFKLRHSNSFCKNVLQKGFRYHKLSDAQISALKLCIARAKAQEESGSNSQFVGAVGERITVDAVCTFRKKFYGYNRFSGRDELSNIVVFKTMGGNIVKTFTWLDIAKGDKLVLTGTVKKHDVYNGEKQTLVNRAKVHVI